MPLSVHKITARQLRAIADGSSTAADLAVLVSSQRSKRLAMLALIVRTVMAARHPEAAVAAEGWRLLTRVQRQASAVVEDLLGYPALGTWATETLLALQARAAVGPPPGRLALFAASAAIRAGVTCVLELPPLGPRAALDLPSLGRVLLPGSLCDEAVVLRCHGETTEIAGRDARVTLPLRLDVAAPGWRPMPVVTAGRGETGIRLLLDDFDPYRFTGLDVPLERLTAPMRREWGLRIAGGWRLLARHHHRTATEVRSLISAITPLSDIQGASRSVTSRRAFGTVALSLPEDDVAMALALSHEVQHAKLAALMDLLPLVTAGPTERLYYAPWRSDPRPLASLLQGMYAHLEVARFWRRHREVAREPSEVHYANVEYARWRKACALVAEVLGAHSELTRSGSLFVSGMTTVLRGWRHDYVPAAAQAEADRVISIHRGQSAVARAVEGAQETLAGSHLTAPREQAGWRLKRQEAVKTLDEPREPRGG